MMQNNAPALAPLIFLFAGIIIPLVALKLRSLAYPLVLAATFSSTFVSISNVFSVLDSGPIRYYFGGWPPPIGIEYVLDPLSGFLTAVINGIAFIVLVHAGKIVEKEIPEHRRVPYYALVMLFLCGCNGIILTGDFFIRFMAGPERIP